MKQQHSPLTGLCWATTSTKEVPDINLLEVTGIWELSALVPACDAEVLDVHTLWFSEKNKKEKEKEGEKTFISKYSYFSVSNRI